jgi:bacterioferritin
MSPPATAKTRRLPAAAGLDGSAVAAGYSANLPAVLKMLNDALATEIVGSLRYRRHHFMARALNGKGAGDEFLAHAHEQMAHADLIADRIVQLGGEPDFAPDSLAARSHGEYVAGASLSDMMLQDLAAERIAIDGYRDFIAYLGGKDPATSDMLKSIMAAEEEHARRLSEILPGPASARSA